MPDHELDQLESYLANAAVLDVAAFSHTTSHRSFRLILEGGVAVMAKPVDTAPEGVVQCYREVAAWRFARALGWPELVATTVMRTITSPSSGGDVETSVQVIWSDNLPEADVAMFSDEDIWCAAAFDVLVGHTDRGGHNWLAVPASGSSPRLKLVDHGSAFPETTTGPNSTFYTMRSGQPLPGYIDDAFTKVAARPVEVENLRTLLGDGPVDALVARASAIAGASVLQI